MVYSVWIDAGDALSDESADAQAAEADGGWKDPVNVFHGADSWYFSSLWSDSGHLVDANSIGSLNAHIDPFGPLNPLHYLVQIRSMPAPVGLTATATCSQTVNASDESRSLRSDERTLIMHSIFGVALALLLLLSSSFGYALQQQLLLRVRLLDATTGKPLKGIAAALSALDDTGRPSRVLNARTDSDGVAVFHLAEPVSARVDLIFPPDELGLCSELQFSTTKIRETGVVGSNACAHPKYEYTVPPKPGELVVFGKAIAWWKRILREIP
jgi:hypothetical protein